MRLERLSFERRLGGYDEAIRVEQQPVIEGRLLRMVCLLYTSPSPRDS